MQKKFRKIEGRELFIFDTIVENVFLSEYMPKAPSEYVKIYLLGLMYANSGYDMDNKAIAKHLGIEIEDVLKAWTYWEKLKAVKKEYHDESNRLEYDIEFLSLKEQLYSVNKEEEIQGPSKCLVNADIKKLLRNIEKRLNRPLSAKEPIDIISLIDDYSASPELIDFCYSYCVKIGRTDVKYVGGVLRKWSEKKIKTAEEAKAFLEEQDVRYNAYKRIMKALGFSRNATEAEQEKIDYWMDILDFSLERIVEACKKTSGISNPNINYVNSIIESWAKADGKKLGEQKKAKEPKLIGAKEVQRYYDYLNKIAKEEAKAREDEIYSKIPKAKSNDEKMREYGIELSRLMVMKSSDSRRKAKEISDRMNEIMAEQAILLADKGYPIDYMKIRYKCEKCKDTGVNDAGNRCTCYGERLREASLWQKP